MKFLFCGLGSIGQRHLRNLRALAGSRAEILAYRQRGGGPVLNPDMTVREGADLESTYNLRAFTNLDDALAERPDAVFVTNPNSLHLPVAMAAAQAGCHLFIEKPIADEPDGVEALIDLVERKGLTAFVAYQFRFHPGLRRLKKWIEEGRLGRLAAAHIVNGEWLPGWHPYEDYRETHPARRELGGGCLRIQTHEMDYALWLFGMPRQVYAIGGHLSRLEVDVEDSVSLLLHCEQPSAVSDQRSGVQEGAASDQGSASRLTPHASRLTPHPLPVHIHLDYLQRPPQRVCEVIGDAGKARYDYYAGQVEFHEVNTRAREVFHFEDFDRNQMFLDELRHFLACVRGQETPLVDLREGLRSMRIAHAADESLRTGQVVAIES